jgi:DNA-binding GntR family transcriptional regulator
MILLAPLALDAPADPASETQAEKAYRLIEDAVVRLELEPGSRITEQDLAGRVGLGRTPVREAVQRLVSDGLLVVYPRKGMAVAAINPLDVLLALDVRAALERLVAAGAARKAGEAQRAHLRQLARGLVSSASAGDALHYMQFDKALDTTLGTASANPYAVRALGPLQTMARRAWYYFRRGQDLEAAAARHAAVVEAVADGDADRAGIASDALMAHVRAGLKQALADL